MAAKTFKCRAAADRAGMLMIAIASCVVLEGCSITGDCAGVGHYGIIATVIDAGTGTAPLSTARVTLRDGTHIEVFAQSNLGAAVYGGASDREGVYSLTVEASGYQTYTQEGIAVRRTGSCGEISSTSLLVRLNKAQ